MRALPISALLVAALAGGLAACGGKSFDPPGSATPQAVTPQAAMPASVASQGRPDKRAATVRIRIAFPKKHAHGPFSRARMRDGRPNPYFTASQTSGISIRVTPQSGTPATTIADISATGPNCTTAAGLRTCTVAVSAQAGSDAFLIATYDAAPVAGVIPATAHQLAVANFTYAIVAGAANTVPVTLDGVIASIGLYVPVASLHGTIASAQKISVYGIDAIGNVIVSDAFYTAGGLPAPIALATSGPSLDGNGHFTVPATVPSEAPNGLTLAYDGGAEIPIKNPISMTGAFTETISASAPGASPASAAISVVGPTASEVIISSSVADPQGIAFDIAGNLWVAQAAKKRFVYITPNRVVNVVNTGLTNTPREIAMGPDKNLWYTEDGGEIGTIVGTTPKEFALAKGVTPNGITRAAGLLWVCDLGGDAIYSVTTKGVATRYALPAGTHPNYITSDANGKLWFTAEGKAEVGTFAPATPKSITYTYLGSGVLPTHLTAYHGAIYVVDGENSYGIGQGVAQVVGGVVTWFSQGGTYPIDVIAAGDGRLWVLGDDNYLMILNPAITNTWANTYYFFDGEADHASLFEFAVAPDGTLWFDNQSGDGRVEQFVW
jgi:streptogramin lyase